jgi:hypothetical protein
MSEAGKEIILREALATHMRSTRDRQLVTEFIQEPRPLEDILSFFASYYLYHYQGLRLLSFEDAQDLTIERKDEMSREERRHLELEIRQLLADKQKEETDLARLVSEFTIAFCNELGSSNPEDDATKQRTIDLIKQYLGMIPQDYAPNHDIDFINIITGWGQTWRDELYVKASGLKETAMSLREELLREHEFEVVETTVLRKGLKELFGKVVYARGRLVDSDIDRSKWMNVVQAVCKRLCQGEESTAIAKAHQLRISIIETLEEEMESPTTISEFETRMGQSIAGMVSMTMRDNPTQAFLILTHFLQLKQDDMKASLRVKGITTAEDLAQLLVESVTPTEVEEDKPTISPEEMEDLERSLKRLEKLEHTLEKPVKGMLKAQGLRAAELDKISIDILTKDKKTLVGIEIKVLEALEKKLRVPSIEEMNRLLLVREQVQSGALSSIGMSTSREMIHRRTQEEAIVAVKLDFVWHFTIGIITNLTRVVESYIRSKQDLLRIKALLKSIYEGTESELQFLREEILIDLTSMRIYEFKVAHPELDASTVCSWMHARLSSQDMKAAYTELDNSPSPVFEGVVTAPLKLSGLEFSNYAIAYDLMHRFLKQQRKELITKEEYALAVERERKRTGERKRGELDVLSWLDTKSMTVFRAISRVGPRGLEWSANDRMKCANLLSYYIQNRRGKPICAACGEDPKDGKCSKHKGSNINNSTDFDNLSHFVMCSITSIKQGLIGVRAEAMTWEEARRIVQREIDILKRRGKFTAKTNIKALLPGEINFIIGPAIADVIGKYFNESLEYAARSSDRA